MRCESNKTIADELIGVWRNRAVQYAGTFFAFKKDQISFGATTGEVFNYAITKIKRKKNRQNDWILYTVYYLNESLQTYEFSFFYQPSGQGAIIFRNMPDKVWSKDES